MGWKTLKERYNITHDVHVSTYEGYIYIGDHEAPAIAVDLETGKVEQGINSPGFGKRYYPELMAAPKEDILRALAAEDVFHRHIPVYTSVRGEVIERYCEEVGYPNLTHDGFLMQHNEYSTDVKVAAEIARKYTRNRIADTEAKIKDLETEVARRKERLPRLYKALEDLDKKYPPATTPSP